MSLFTNVNTTLKFSKLILTIFGIWAPPCLNSFNTRLFTFYSFLILSFTLGVYIIIQTGDIIQVWGNVPLMSQSAFLLVSNFAFLIKVVYIMVRRKLIQKMISVDEVLEAEDSKIGIKIVTRYHKETVRLTVVYNLTAFSSLIGLMCSAKKNELPLPAWYPFDTSKTPAYQITYAHQIIALNIAGAINLCCDTLVTSLIAQCRCRLRLIAMSLMTLCDDLDVDDKGRMTQQGEVIVLNRLRCCVMDHQAVLEHVKLLQHCFSIPTFVQFAVPSFIICVTAYQMAFETNLLRLVSMASYAIVITMQVFIYCYEGEKLVIDSGEICRAAYDCPWYMCSVSIRRPLFMMMMRSTRPTKLSAGSLVQLSLATFMSIIKASYSFFTVLQSTTEE